ncbi:MAG: DUF1501 domain-containing protein [Gemmataceae bacterium]|nr:DUF1501 domain-containing protein [Gemmataceae bacterium]
MAETVVYTRRKLIQVGVAGAVGLGLPRYLAARPLKAHAKSVILLHQFGGPGQHETFDLKPGAPDGIRGAFGAIPSKLPGVPVCELLPKTAQVMDKVCVVRSLNHRMVNHNSAAYYSLTGKAPPLDDIRLRDTLDLAPAYGSVVDKFRPADGGMPSFVAFPHRLADGSITPGQHASFLGKRHNPFLFTQDPNDPNFRLPELSLPAGLSIERLLARRELLRELDKQSDLLEHSATAQGIEQNYDRAVAMLTAPAVKKAFDLQAEPAKYRDMYGRTTYGQSCLLARRLVEAGARFINVYFAAGIGGQGLVNGWDTHGFNGHKMNPILKDYLLPITDHTLPVLLNDLDERGLLDTTLVIWMGEFGRSPRISKAEGRDHWPHCYTALLAGGGVKRGHVFGASDKIGAYPVSDPVSPDDLAATVFSLLGIDPGTEVRDALGRPVAISSGQPIAGILA